MNKTARISSLSLLCLGVGCVTTPPSLEGVLSGADLAGIPSGRYDFSPETADIAFSVRPVALNPVEGEFSQFEAVFDATDIKGGRGMIAADVDVTSVAMANKTYEEMVRGPGWFDVEAFPAAMFRGQMDGWQADGTALVNGQMTIRDVTRDETLSLQLYCDGLTVCPDQEIGFRGSLTVSRSAYGMTRLSAIVRDEVELVVTGTIRPAQDNKK